jgi:hypothetical protein
VAVVLRQALRRGLDQLERETQGRRRKLPFPAFVRRAPRTLCTIRANSLSHCESRPLLDIRSPVAYSC